MLKVRPTAMTEKSGQAIQEERLQVYILGLTQICIYSLHSSVTTK